MILLPAIDLYEKKAVRLYKGDYQNMTVYSEDPPAVAAEFERLGASWIHIVDLEGAKEGTSPNFSVIQEIIRRTSLKAEVGGGIRRMETVRRYLEAGAERVILGTAAVTDEVFLTEAARVWGDRIAVGADVKDGCIAIKGWREKSSLTLEEFLEKMQSLGIQTVICTDISRDGAMKGTNRELYKKLSEACSMNIIASGGVSDLEDVRALRDLGLYGAIIGKAWYTGAIDLARALEEAR